MAVTVSSVLDVMNVVQKLEASVVGIYVGCEACVSLARNGTARMEFSAEGLVPRFSVNAVLPELACEACPGKGVDYPKLYEQHYGSLPSDWRVGHVDQLWTGHAADPEIRRKGASGG